MLMAPGEIRMSATIDIFGDSFADPEYNDGETWLDQLQFDVINYSKSGIGPQYIIETMMGVESSDYLLVMFPDFNRLSLDYLDPTLWGDAQKIYHMVKDGVDPLVIQDGHKIHRDFDGFYNTGLHRILEVLMIQFILSRPYKWILIWRSSSRYPFNRNYSIRIPDNAYIVPRPLYEISINEFGKIPNPDKRSNHLSTCNHKVLAKQVNDFFNHCIKPDPSIFWKNVAN